MAVWSCVLRGRAADDVHIVDVSDGDDMTPIINLSVEKAGAARWGGFIAGIGEDSIL